MSPLEFMHRLGALALREWGIFSKHCAIDRFLGRRYSRRQTKETFNFLFAGNTPRACRRRSNRARPAEIDAKLDHFKTGDYRIDRHAFMSKKKLKFAIK